MRLLLIQPPVRDFYDTDVRLQPIGLAYLKAAVAKHLPDIEVIVKDFHGGCGRKTVTVPTELRYLSEYYPFADKSPFSTFHQYYHFGKSFDDIEAEVAALNPDVVGISSLFTPYFREALKVAARVKKRTRAIVVIGGSHASAVPQSLLSSPHVDYVIRGEGEKPLVEFLRCLDNRSSVEQIANLAYKRDGEIIYNAIQDNFPIDELPIPDLSDFVPATYTLAGKPMTFMITSRSCPHKCSFCSVHTTFGTDYRRRSLEKVLEEIILRYQQGYRVIDFEDDNLTFYKQTFKELCRRLIEGFPNRQMQFVAMNGISYLSLDDELLELMYQAGFSHLNLALVSSDKTVRETTKRPHTLEAYVKVVSKAHQLGFKIVSYQILGLPNETLDSMIQTLAFNARLPVLLGASPFYQTPNAPISRGLDLTETDFVRARLTALAIETDSFSRDDIYTLFVTTRIVNFLKGLAMPETTNLTELMTRHWPDPRTRIGFDLLEKLIDTGRLFYSTPQGLVENRKFRTALLARVFSEIGAISCQEGGKVSVDEFARNLLARRVYSVLGTVTRKVAPVELGSNEISPP
ncbi:MAG: B12-binding domain-containing radical SAM protein [Deltaproteobacteria bacterium]|nr:B12-binding domain-containing radical SAM protein [Deltaproteobacteria bacterium]